MLEPLEMSDVSRAESPLVLIPAYNAGPSVGEVVAQVRALGLPVVVGQITLLWQGALWKPGS